MKPIKIEPYPDEENVVLSQIKLNYSQAPDSNDVGQIDQHLKIWIEDAGSGNYFVMKTKRWAFDDIDNLIAVLQDAKHRLTNDQATNTTEN